MKLFSNLLPSILVSWYVIKSTFSIGFKSLTHNNRGVGVGVGGPNQSYRDVVD